MKIHTLVFLAALGLLLTSPGLSFAAETTQAEAKSSPAAAPAAVAAKAGTGELWTERCNKEEKNEGPKRGRCEVFQRLIMKDTGQRVVEVAVGFPREKKTARGIVIVPLGVLLAPGVQMKIDGGEPFKFQMRFCDVGGCFSFVDLNDDVIARMSAGKNMTLTFQAATGKAVNVELSLKDFAKAVQKIK